MPNIKWNYNKSINGFKDARIKGLGAQVSALIEESVKDSANKKSAIPYLFNETKSDKQVETIAIEDGYDLMDPTADGDKAKTDKTNQIGEKSISHIIFTKNVVISETMMEDSYYSMDPSIELRARSLPDAYWKTREKIAQSAYIEGEKSSFDYRGAKVDLTTYDGKPLFSTQHTYGDKEKGHAFGKQSNLFYIVDANPSAGAIAEMISKMAAIINQMKNSNGEAQDFDADTIFVPRGVQTSGGVDKVRRAIGSEFFPGTANNDINTQYGQWNFVPLALWQPDELEIMIMSQDAKRMMKSMFYNRINLNVNVWEEPGTGNLNYRARTRFGLGHVDYKHVAKLKILKEAPSDTSGMTRLVVD